MWEYQQTRTVLSQRELDLGHQASHGPMRQRFAASREILHYDSNNWQALKLVRQCGERFPCKSKYCQKCFHDPINPHAWRVDPHRFIADDVVNPVYYPHFVGRGAYYHIERTLGMLEPFYGLPVREVVPATVKLCYLQGGENMVAVKDFYHARMRDIGTVFRDVIHPDVKIVYRFEWSWTTAGQAKQDLPLRGPGVRDVNDMDPDQVVALFHAHCLAHFPGYDYTSAGDIFRIVFDGRHQVHVATPQYDKVVGDYCGEQAGLSFEELSRTAVALPVIEDLLEDHPDDFQPEFEHEQDTQTTRRESRRTDRLLDFYADLYDQASGLGEYAIKPEDVERQSGLVRYASYACKEHLPKAASRFTKQTNSNGSGSSSGCPRSSTSTNANSVDKDEGVTLTPEQMVIAIHADSEMKRALKGKRLMHAFGVVSRSKSKALTRDHEDEEQDDVGFDYVQSPTEHQPTHELSRNDQSDQLDTDTTVVWSVGPSATGNGPAFQREFDMARIKLVLLSICKEAGSLPTSNLLFYGLREAPFFKLCLGVRVLRPP